jgi:ABC-type sugar transport system substrate-binding protein
VDGMGITIGFSNLDERNAFARELRQQLERTVSAHDDIQLIVRDNQHNTEQALVNVQEFIRREVDIAIIYHIDERSGMKLVMPLRMKKIPIIAIEFQLPGSTFIGIDNVTAGEMSGREGGKWISDHWSGQFDKITIFTDQRVISSHQARFMSAMAMLKSSLSLRNIDPLWVDSGTESQVAGERFAELLESWKDQHRIAVITMGDVVSRGVIEAARELGREEDIAVMSFDGTAWAHEEFENASSRLIVSPYFNLEHYCQQMLELAQAMSGGAAVPPHTAVQPILLVRSWGKAQP